MQTLDAAAHPAQPVRAKRPFCVPSLALQHMVHVMVRRVLVDLMEALTAALEARRHPPAPAPGSPAGSPFFADNCARSSWSSWRRPPCPSFRHAFGVPPKGNPLE